MKQLRKKHRKYLFGSKYVNIFHDFAQIIDVRDHDGSTDLIINYDNDKHTTLKIRDISTESESMDTIKRFINNANMISKARNHSGDLGSMFAFGFHNSKHGNYVSMNNDNGNCRRYCIEMRRLLENYFKEEISEIINADRRQGKFAGHDMGDTDGISAYCLVSKDLVNSAHYDLDTSPGISLFVEDTIDKATGWYFILPNTYSNETKKAIIIKLFNGCAISWDGRKIFHCTGLENLGEDNHVYGCYFGGKKYK